MEGHLFVASLGTFTKVAATSFSFPNFMTHTIRTMLFVFTALLLCLPATGLACGGSTKAAQHKCCVKGEAKKHLCENGKAEKQETGKDCGGDCSDCCAQHVTENIVLPVIPLVKPVSFPNTSAKLHSYSEEYSFTDLHLIWTPPKMA